MSLHLPRLRLPAAWTRAAGMFNLNDPRWGRGDDGKDEGSTPPPGRDDPRGQQRPQRHARAKQRPEQVGPGRARRQRGTRDHGQEGGRDDVAQAGQAIGQRQQGALGCRMRRGRRRAAQTRMLKPGGRPIWAPMR